MIKSKVEKNIIIMKIIYKKIKIEKLIKTSLFQKVSEIIILMKQINSKTISKVISNILLLIKNKSNDPIEK